MNLVKTNEVYENGQLVKTEHVPWTQDDFVRHIEFLESQITPRRRDEAILSDTGRRWLESARSEIDVFRRAMQENV